LVAGVAIGEHNEREQGHKREHIEFAARDEERNEQIFSLRGSHFAAVCGGKKTSGTRSQNFTEERRDVGRGQVLLPHTEHVGGTAGKIAAVQGAGGTRAGAGSRGSRAKRRGTRDTASSNTNHCICTTPPTICTSCTQCSCTPCSPPTGT
jgi:hypothetical protein